MAMTKKFDYEFRIESKNGAPLNEQTKRFRELRKLDFSAYRRNEMLKLFKAGYKTHVNIEGCIIIKHDSDIKYLLKKGHIELCNERKQRFTFFTIKHSFIQLKRS